mmetsp:Transcript_36669/g.92678  ORF Transcript_36669/g.92678 Transcript_36669/m.92678 type:complete len:275 (-) Transcript_36669:186-1010(-)
MRVTCASGSSKDSSPMPEAPGRMVVKPTKRRETQRMPACCCRASITGHLPSIGSSHLPKMTCIGNSPASLSSLFSRSTAAGSWGRCRSSRMRWIMETPLETSARKRDSKEDTRPGWAPLASPPVFVHPEGGAPCFRRSSSFPPCATQSSSYLSSRADTGSTCSFSSSISRLAALWRSSLGRPSPSLWNQAVAASRSFEMMRPSRAVRGRHQPELPSTRLSMAETSEHQVEVITVRDTLGTICDASKLISTSSRRCMKMSRSTSLRKAAACSGLM